MGAIRAQRNAPWDGAFADSPFEPLRYERFAESITVGPDRLLDMYSTTSSLAAIEPEERDGALREVRPLLDGSFLLPLRHGLAWTRLT